MNAPIVAALVLTAAAGTAVVLNRRPDRQAVVMSVLGVCLSLLFLVVQAPDVALSQLAVGTAVVPLMVMLTVRKISRQRQAAKEEDDGDGRSDESGDGGDGGKDGDGGGSGQGRDGGEPRRRWPTDAPAEGGGG